jgi:hypothetical protein
MAKKKGTILHIQKGQNEDILKYFPAYNKEESTIIAEGGCDNGKTFLGRFLVKIYRKGVYRFDDGKLTKKVK